MPRRCRSAHIIRMRPTFFWMENGYLHRLKTFQPKAEKKHFVRGFLSPHTNRLIRNKIDAGIIPEQNFAPSNSLKISVQCVWFNFNCASFGTQRKSIALATKKRRIHLCRRRRRRATIAVKTVTRAQWIQWVYFSVQIVNASSPSIQKIVKKRKKEKKRQQKPFCSAECSQPTAVNRPTEREFMILVFIKS